MERVRVNDYPKGPVRHDEKPRRRTGQGVPFMTSAERDELITKLRRQGCTLVHIGRRCGMSANGVLEALHRISEGRPGRDPRG
jgi:hypothetical protein